MIERTGLLNFGNPKYVSAAVLAHARPGASSGRVAALWSYSTEALGHAHCTNAIYSYQPRAGVPYLAHIVAPQVSGPEGNLMAPKQNLERLKMPYKEMNADDIMAEYPFKNLPETFKGLFAVDNGVINVPLLLRTLTRLCSFHGAKIYENAGVNHIEISEGGVKIEAVDTQTGEKRWVYAKKAALTCGAYVNDLLGPNFGFELSACGRKCGPRLATACAVHLQLHAEARPLAQGRPQGRKKSPCRVRWVCCREMLRRSLVQPLAHFAAFDHPGTSTFGTCPTSITPCRRER